MTFRLVLSVACAVLLVAGGCRDRSGSRRRPRSRARCPTSVPKLSATFEDTVRRLQDLGSDEARWRHEKPLLEMYVGVFPERTLGKVVRVNLLAVDHASLLWLRAYPGITKRTELDANDLELLSERLAINTPITAPVRTSYGIALGPVDVTGGDVARQWLHRLVGREFRDQEDFATWLAENRARLVWQADRGAFSLQGNPATGPASQEVQR